VSAKHRVRYDAYSEGWKRVEAVRKALFDSAAKAADYADELGYGMLRAADALSLQAAPASRLAASPTDAVDYTFLKLLLGDAAPAFAATAGAKLSMLDLEAAQVAAKSGLETRRDGRDANVEQGGVRLLDRVIGVNPQAPVRRVWNRRLESQPEKVSLHLLIGRRGRQRRRHRDAARGADFFKRRAQRRREVRPRQHFVDELAARTPLARSRRCWRDRRPRLLGIPRPVPV
jgi:hypothetical protein